MKNEELFNSTKECPKAVLSPNSSRTHCLNIQCIGCIKTISIDDKDKNHYCQFVKRDEEYMFYKNK